MDNFDLRKFLAEGKLHEEADLNLPDMKVKIEKSLKKENKKTLFNVLPWALLKTINSNG